MARVLLIEDNEALQKMLCDALANAGHEVTAADDGRQALTLFRRHPTELVVSDIVLPEEDGISVLMTLRKEFPDVPLIAMSGHSPNSPLYLRIAEQLGARRTLGKPFKTSHLVELINEVCEECGLANR